MRLLARRGITILAAAAVLTTVSAGGVGADEGDVSEYVLPSSTDAGIADAQDLVRGADGALWFPMPAGTGNHVGRIDLAGNLSVFEIDGKTNADTHLALGADGAMWFTQWSGGDLNRLGRIDQAGAYTFVDLPSGSVPHGIAAAPDGSLWIACWGNRTVIRYDPRAGTSSSFEVPADAGSPEVVAIDPAGRGAFVATDSGRLLLLAADGSVLSNIDAGHPAVDLEVAPDGRLWLAFGTWSEIGRLEADGATVTRFSAEDFATRLAFDTLGKLWMATKSASSSTLNRFDPATGAVAHFPVGSVGGAPTAVALAGDGQIWFIESRSAADPANPGIGRDAIGRALTGAPPPVVPPASPAPVPAPDVAIVFPGPFDLPITAQAIALGTGFTALIALFVGLPTRLFNSTLSSNLLESRRLFRLGLPHSRRFGLRRRVLLFAALTRRVGRTPLGAVAYILLLAVVLWFREPVTGQHPELISLATTLLVIVTMALAGSAAGSWYVRRVRHAGTRVRVAFWTVLIALGCVVISRVTDARPGYLFGIVGFTAFTVALTPRDKGIIARRNMAVVLAVGLLAWFVRVPFQTSDLHPDLATLTINRVLVGIFVAAVETAVFGLIPLRFLAGNDLLHFSPPSWAALWLAALFLFAYVILLPPVGYVPTVDSGGVLALAATVAIYNLVAIAFWAYFAVWRPRRLARARTMPPC